MLLSGDGSVSTFHRDIWGFWTAVEMNEGEKLWAWAESSEENTQIRKNLGPITSVSEFSKVFGVLLRPGDLFLMNPGAIHAVVTKGDSCALGMHFLLAETLAQSLILAKEDTMANHITNEDEKIRNSSRAFYFELCKVCLPLYGLMTEYSTYTHSKFN